MAALVLADPARRPLASRYSVRAPLELGRVTAVPVIRPEASRVTAWTAPPACLWRSTVWTTRPEESRTTSRQVSAEEAVVSAMGVAAVMRLTLGKGCLVVAIPYLLLILLVCCLTAGMMALMVPVFSQMGY